MKRFSALSFVSISRLFLSFVLASAALVSHGQTWSSEGLAVLTPGKTRAVNALWSENPLAAQFRSTNRVVVANLRGPAEITMMHFAYPEHRFLNPDPRDLRLCIFWDGESNPSVDCPLVDFFCDPNGERDVVNTALVNGHNVGTYDGGWKIESGDR